MGTLTYFNLQEYIDRYKCSVFVETGTGGGDGLEFARKFPFSKIYSVEINPAQASAMGKRFGADPRIRMHTGRSDVFLKSILPEIRGNAVFWLDAHYPGADLGFSTFDSEKDLDLRLPLEKELDIIAGARAGFNDVIICDDLRIYEKVPVPGGDLSEIGLGNLAKYGKDIFEQYADRFNVQRIYADTGYVVLTPKDTGGLHPARKTAIGFLGGHFGDVLVEEPTIRAFLAQNPDYNLMLACNKKYADILQFYKGYSDRIVGFYGYEGYDETWPSKADVDYLNEHKVDAVFNAMAQHKYYYWWRDHHITVECGKMFGIRIGDSQIRLPLPPRIPDNKEYIALSLYPNGGQGVKVISPQKIRDIAAYCASKGYKLLQLNSPGEPNIPGAEQTNSSFYEAGVAMLGCRMLVSCDSAMSWLASAFDVPTVCTFSTDCYFECVTTKNWQPVNKNAAYLEADRAENIPTEEIFNAIDRLLLSTRPAPTTPSSL